MSIFIVLLSIFFGIIIGILTPLIIYKEIKITPVFVWYDFWVGLFYDKPKRRVYFFPLPCLGLRIDL